jgi:hypothetical protein
MSNHITITSEAFSAALDYLPVAVRASHSNPGNDILWLEAVLAQRAIIEYANARLVEEAAAEVQALVGTIAGIAEWSYDYAVRSGVQWSEQSKAEIRRLVAAHR